MKTRLEKSLHGKAKNDFPTKFGNPANNTRFPLFQTCDGSDVSVPSGLQVRSMSERNGLRRCSSLCGNENHPSSTHFVDKRRADTIMVRSSAPKTDRIHLHRPIHPRQRLCLQSGGGPYICHSSGCGLSLADHPCGIWGQVMRALAISLQFHIEKALVASFSTIAFARSVNADGGQNVCRQRGCIDGPASIEACTTERSRQPLARDQSDL